MYPDNNSYCESCSTCNPRVGSASSYSDSDSSDDGRKRSRVKYVPSCPAYPRQHSFVVDMNNRPVYEMDKKPRSPKKSTASLPPRRSASQPPPSAGCSLAHLPPGPAVKDNSVYYPPKSPFGKEEKQRRKSEQGEGGLCSKKAVLLCLLVLFCLVLYLALLGPLAEVHGTVGRIEAILEEKFKLKTSSG